MMRTLYLHIFSRNSGECALQHYLSQQSTLLSSYSFCWPCPRFDIYSGFKSHNYLFSIFWNIHHHADAQIRESYRQHLRTAWRNINCALGQSKKFLLSLENQPSCWEDLWSTATTYMDFSGTTVVPIITLRPQEDSLEYIYRKRIWEFQNQDHFQPDELCDYYKSLHILYENAIKHSIRLTGPRIFWQVDETQEAEQITLHAVLNSCGLPAIAAPARDEDLRSHNALRFAALTLPTAAPYLYRELGIRSRYPGNAWNSPITRNIRLALRQGEDQGSFSLAPLSDSRARESAHFGGAPGNTLLAKSFPHLAVAIAASPLYPSTREGTILHPLSSEAIDASLDCLTLEQQTYLRDGLRTGYFELTPEQQHIEERLEARPRPVPRIMESDSLASVLTLTYNHQNFISQNMDSVLEQETNFPVQHIIVDDGSEDGTQDIIDNYACRHKSIKPVFLANHGAGNVRALFESCRTPLAALCDGDDYFTDPHKLQIQVDTLAATPDLSMCFHLVKVIHQDRSQCSRIYPPVDQLPRGLRSVYYLSDLFKGNFIQTCSVMYRWRFTEGLPDWFVDDIVPGDWYWHLLHAEKGKIGFIEKAMSVYRRHRGSYFYSAENFTSIQHRRLHGMQELRSYAIFNSHFQRRYERAILGLTNNVLLDFLKYDLEEGSDKLMKEAKKNYPDFVRFFLKSIKIVRAPSRENTL